MRLDSLRSLNLRCNYNIVNLAPFKLDNYLVRKLDTLWMHHNRDRNMQGMNLSDILLCGYTEQSKYSTVHYSAVAIDVWIDGLECLTHFDRHKNYRADLVMKSEQEQTRFNARFKYIRPNHRNLHSSALFEDTHNQSFIKITFITLQMQRGFSPRPANN